MGKKDTLKVGSLRDIRRLKINFDEGIEVGKAGSHYRARLQGRANSVFGETAEEAKQRLCSAVAKNLGIVPRPISNFENGHRRRTSTSVGTSVVVR